jgi:hypothetical protein
MYQNLDKITTTLSLVHSPIWRRIALNAKLISQLHLELRYLWDHPKIFDLEDKNPPQRDLDQKMLVLQIAINNKKECDFPVKKKINNSNYEFEVLFEEPKPLEPPLEVMSLEFD